MEDTVVSGKQLLTMDLGTISNADDPEVAEFLREIEEMRRKHDEEIQRIRQEKDKEIQRIRQEKDEEILRIREETQRIIEETERLRAENQRLEEMARRLRQELEKERRLREEELRQKDQKIEQERKRREEETRKVDVLRERVVELQTRLPQGEGSSQVDNRLRAFKELKYEMEKFEWLKKKVGPFTSNLNSKTWIERLEVELEMIDISYEHFLGSMRFFFTPTDDDIVKTWYENKETLLVSRVREAREDQDRLEGIWEDFKKDFIEQFDPDVRARTAEEEYESFKLQENMTAVQYVSKLQAILLKMDPKMKPEELVGKMHRRLPKKFAVDIFHEDLKTVPKFQLRLECLIKHYEYKSSIKGTSTNEASSAKKILQAEASDGSLEAPIVGQFQRGTLRCYYCNKPGHVIRDCYKRRNDERWEEDQEYDEEWDEDEYDDGSHNRKRARRKYNPQPTQQKFTEAAGAPMGMMQGNGAAQGCPAKKAGRH